MSKGRRRRYEWALGAGGGGGEEVMECGLLIWVVTFVTCD